MQAHRASKSRSAHQSGPTVDPAARAHRDRAGEAATSLETDVLALQSAVGNQLVGRLLAGAPPTSGGNPLVQRLAFKSKKLFAPPTWMGTRVKLETGEANTIETLYGGAKKDKVKSDLGTSLGLEIDELKAASSTDALKDEGYKPSETAMDKRIDDALTGHLKLINLDRGIPTTPYEVQLATRPVLPANQLFPERNDLKPAMNWRLACSLIAIVHAEGDAAVISWLEDHGVTVGNNRAKSDLTNKLHTYYYVERKLMYDDLSTHPRLYADWGYRLVFSTGTNFESMLGMSDILKPGGKYIVDIEGHTTLLELKQKLRPLKKGEKVTDFFTLTNDKSNWELTDADTMKLPVHAIFAK